MAFGEENDPPAWTVEVSTFASSLAKQAKEKASSLVDEAVAFASEAVTVKTREELALRPDQHHIALAASTAPWACGRRGSRSSW